MDEALILLTALGLGALIGLERKLNDRSAGIHTHALVSLGAALFSILGLKLGTSGDAGRMASQIVMGVGFLCGAVVMREGTRVRGMNTAVTIWCSAAIGAIAGARDYTLAIEGAVLVTVANFLLHIIEHRLYWLSSDAHKKQ